MSDIWNPNENKEQEDVPSGPVEEASALADAAEEAAAPVQPEEPVAEAASVPMPEVTPVPPQPIPPVAQPTYQQPPVNGWSSDGGYRYVPPRPVQPTYTPPPAPQYGYPPAGNTYTPYRSPAAPQPTYGYSPVPPTVPTTPSGGQPPKKQKGWTVALALIAAVAVVGCMVVGIYAAVSKWNQPDVGTPSVGGSSDASQGENSGGLGENAPSLDINAWENNDGGLMTKEIVKRNYASTVLLTAYVQSNDYYYFGQSSLVEAGASTGIVMTTDGFIITNRHCVINESTGQPYDQIDVTLYGGKVYEKAKVIGADESTDLAVIRVEATDLTPAQFGDSAELEVGDRVVALGNAAGLEWSASEGIVSALARDVYEDTGYAIKCLQVDASINPGNSGGPLLNNQGLVVGINSAKISATDYEGIGFTIPINEAKTIIDSLIKHGYVKGRVALGISGQTISSGMYNGFMITEIQTGSDLNNKGVQVGDLIVGVDGVTVTDYGTLRAELAKHKVGDKVKLELLHSDRRTGKVTSYSVQVELKEQTN